MTTTRTRNAVLLAAAAALPTALAQPETPAVTDGATTTFALEDLPPAVQLGVRAEVLRRLIPVAPIVVIVPSPDVYLEALDRWNVAARFPILIDDGSVAAAEDIARFCRAFQPRQVITYNGFFKRGLADLDKRVNLVVAHTWGAPEYDKLPEVMEAVSFTPPGVVVASKTDPAWTAAAALASGRGQPLVWVDVQSDPKAGPSGVWEESDLRRIEDPVRAFLNGSGLEYKKLGDYIEAVTICLNCPARVKVGAETLATTDLIGRHATARADRWAWAGQVHGNEAQAAYRAMCALFLTPRSAWLFDGYTSAEGFAAYDVAPAAKALEEAGFTVIADNAPTPSPDIWRRRALRPVAADFIHVNSAGYRQWFELPPGAPGLNRANVGDVPQLLRPATVHFVHSYSAETPADVASIAGRFLENGAFIYCGAVHEPYLHAFHPPGKLAQRILTATPLGAAVRMDGGEPWKVAYFGDPLFTYGLGLEFNDTPQGRKGAGPAEAEIPVFLSSRELKDVMSDALRAKDYPRAVRLLIMLGRDADAVKVVEAVQATDTGAFTPELARTALRAAQRAGRADLAFSLFLKLLPEDQSDPLLLDAFWAAARTQLPDTTSNLLLDTLKKRFRPYAYADDAAAVARTAARLFGAGAGQDILRAALPGAPDEWHRARISEELDKLR